MASNFLITTVVFITIYCLSTLRRFKQLGYRLSCINNFSVIYTNYEVKRIGWLHSGVVTRKRPHLLVLFLFLYISVAAILSINFYSDH